jgi:hypothetical protein
MGDWRRKHDPPRGDPYIPAHMLDRHLHPQSLEDLVRSVQDAERNGKRLRACGSHWSLSPVVCEPRFDGRILETYRLNRTLYHVIPDCLSEPVRELLGGQMPAPAGAVDEATHTLYHVEAGVVLYDLYTRLDGQDSRWSAPTADLHPQLPGPWAMATLPAACGQTLAGAISTGTHGTDHDRAPLADTIQAVHLVGAGGRQFWIERAHYSTEVDAPMCNAVQLRTALTSTGHTDLTILQDDDALDSVLVSVGRMGVIYSVVLQVVTAHAIEETRQRRTWSAVQRELLDSTSRLFSQRSLQVVVNPLPTGRHGERTCWVTQRRTIPLPQPLPRRWRGRRLRGTPDTAGHNPPADLRKLSLRSFICAAPSLARVFGIAGVVALLLAAAVALRLSLVAGGFLAAIAAVLLAVAASYRGSVGDLVGVVWNRLAASSQSRLLAAMVERSIADEQRIHRRPFRDVSYAVLDRHNYADRCCVTDGDALEVAFDADTDLAVRFVNECLFSRVQELLEPPTGRGIAGAAYVSVRFTRRTRAHLGMQRWNRTCLVTVAGLGSFAGIAPLLDALQCDALGMGATVHWGQRNDLTRAQVEASYPALATWRATLRRLSARGDPYTFSTAYTRRAGLEPDG